MLVLICHSQKSLANIVLALFKHTWQIPHAIRSFLLCKQLLIFPRQPFLPDPPCRLDFTPFTEVLDRVRHMHADKSAAAASSTRSNTPSAHMSSL